MINLYKKLDDKIDDMFLSQCKVMVDEFYLANHDIEHYLHDQLDRYLHDNLMWELRIRLMKDLSDKSN